MDVLQAQGDLIVVPLAEVAGRSRPADGARWREVPPDGIEVLRGGTGGNAHTLVAEPGTCTWTDATVDPTGLTIGVFEAMTSVRLTHREHGTIDIAAGSYVIRRQREQGTGPAAAPAPAGPAGVAHRHTPRGLDRSRVGSERFVCD
jgi:hypothetical protein